MSICELCPKKSSIDCCDKKFCEACIATHITSIVELKHNPMPSNLQRSQEITKAIHKKIVNELLELQEFKTSSLKVISGFSSELKQEIDEYINRFNLNFLQACRKIQIDLMTATQVLYTTSVKSHILELFTGVQNIEDINKVKIISKEFDLPVLSIKSHLENSLSFNLNVEFQSNPEDKSFFMQRTLPVSSLDDSRKSFVRTSSSLGLPSPASKFRVLDFSKPISDTLYSVFPFSNKIFSYNIKDESKSEILLEGPKFPSKTAWSLTKDGRLIITGGFDELPRKTCYNVSFHNNRCEEQGKMAVGRYNHCQLTIDNHVYVFGGMNKSAVQECEKFSLDTKKWTKFANLNVGRECPSGIYYLGKVYISGGNGIESIEVCQLNSKKFELLRIRLPMPGRVNSFFMDNQTFMLVRDKVIVMDFNTNTYKIVGRINESSVWTSSDYLISEGLVFWVAEGRLVTFHVKDLTFRLTE